MANNADWLNPLNYIAFLRDVGRHFSVNRMLTMDGAAPARAQQPLIISRIQLHDPAGVRFLELYRRYGCRLQMGGSDQWGNIVCGIDLARRMHNARIVWR